MIIPEEIILIMQGMQEMGLWKFYLLIIGLLVPFISSIAQKKKTQWTVGTIAITGTLIFFIASLLVIMQFNS